MKYLKIYSLLVFFSFTISCKEKNENYKAINKLETLANNDSLTKSIIELRLKVNKLYKDYESDKEFKTFIKVTTIDDLVYLTDCEIPLVRCFAFKGLVVKDYPKIKEIALKHYNDVEIVKRQNYDIETTTNVFDYMLNELHPMAKTKYKLSRKEYDYYLDLRKK